MDNDLKKLAVQAALQKMTKKGWFDVCNMKIAADLMGVHFSSEQQEFMTLLHCVNFGDMVPELRDGLKEMIEDIFSAEAFEITVGKTWLGKPKKKILRLA